jgi:hypothetical protein
VKPRANYIDALIQRRFSVGTVMRDLASQHESTAVDDPITAP